MHDTGSRQGLAVILVLIILAGGCLSEPNRTGNGGAVVVAVSILPQAEFVHAIAGDRAEVIVLIPPGANPATYEPTADQLTALSRAGIYCMVGSGLPFEHVYVPRLAAANPAMRLVNTSAGIVLIDRDPHIWTSPVNAVRMVWTMAEALAEADPEYAENYRANASDYEKKLVSLDTEIRSLTADLPGRTFIVFHPSWGYFAHEYGLVQVSIEEDGKEPSPGHLAKVIDLARREQIHVILANPQFSRQSVDTVARQVNATIVEVDPLSEDYARNLLFLAQTLAGERAA
jgi:zinc transport system substrate-binding protein